MSGFLLPITCPQCGGDVHLVNAASSGILAVSIVACPPCQRQWEVTARIIQHAKEPGRCKVTA